MADLSENSRCLKELFDTHNNKQNSTTPEESEISLSEIDNQIDSTDKVDNRDIELQKANALAESDSSHSEKSKTFVFSDEGHTLGNALRCLISSYPDVLFCGYTVPHPAESKMHFRIQMHKGKAVDALKQGLEELVQVCDITLEKFDEELKTC